MPILPFESAVLHAKVNRHRPAPPRRPLGPQGMLTAQGVPAVDPNAAWTKLARQFRPIKRPMMGGTY